ncbi:hypothetical protein Q2941_45500 [Bradyrhizobium sp. UFLA05-153]
MVLPPFRILRNTNINKDAETKHVVEVQAALERARHLLKNNPRPSSFAGQQTYKPFPKEDER